MTISNFFSGDDVFISYSRKDGAVYATALAAQLQDKNTGGLKVYFDRYGSTPEKTIPAKVKSKILGANVFVLIASEEALKSKHVQDEVSLFVERRVKTDKGTFVCVDFGTWESTPWAKDKLYTTMAFSKESPDALSSGSASGLAINTIIKGASTYMRQSQRIRRATILAIFLILIITAVGGSIGYFQTMQVTQKTNEINNLNAGIDKLKSDFSKDSLTTSLRILKLNDSVGNIQKQLGDEKKNKEKVLTDLESRTKLLQSSNLKEQFSQSLLNGFSNSLELLNRLSNRLGDDTQLMDSLCNNAITQSIRENNPTQALTFLNWSSAFFKNKEEQSSLVKNFQEVCKKFKDHRFRYSALLAKQNPQIRADIEHAYYDFLIDEVQSAISREEKLVVLSLLWENLDSKKILIDKFRDGSLKIPYIKDLSVSEASQDMIMTTVTPSGNHFVQLVDKKLNIYDSNGELLSSIMIKKHTNNVERDLNDLNRVVQYKLYDNRMAILNHPSVYVGGTSWAGGGPKFTDPYITWVNLLELSKDNSPWEFYENHGHSNMVGNYSKLCYYELFSGYDVDYTWASYPGSETWLTDSIVNANNNFVLKTSTATLKWQNQIIGLLDGWVHMKLEIEKIDNLVGNRLTLIDLPIHAMRRKEIVYTAFNNKNNFIVQGNRIWDPDLNRLFQFETLKKVYPDIAEKYRIQWQ